MECDFVVKSQDSVVSVIQVSKTLKDVDTEKRELKGLLTAMKKFNLQNGVILTLDEENTIKVDGKCIKVVPIWKWLLEDKY